MLPVAAGPETIRPAKKEKLAVAMDALEEESVNLEK